jgi:PAS domain S-box-containing protein
MFLFWGAQHVQFYNDAYRPSLGSGGRHPKALGATGREFWTDIWDIIGPEIRQVLSGGAAIWHEDRLIPIERDGKLDDVYWTYGYSPAFGEDGTIQGVLVVCQETTARIKAEAEARRNGERLSTVLESITDAFFTLDPEWRFTFLNTEAERLLERNRNRLLGETLWDAFPESVGSPFETNYRLAVASNEVVRFESYYEPFHRWFTVSAYPSDEGLGVYFHDVTSQKDIEQQLRQKEQLLVVAGKTARLGGWIYEVGAEHVFWSDEVCAIHEVPAGTTPSLQEAINYYAPEWQPIITAEFGRCAVDGTPFDLDLQIITSKGDLVWVQAIGSAARDDEGVIRRVQGAFQDISARKKAEAAVKESETQWQLLSHSLATTLDNIADGIIATDEGGAIRRMNAVAEQITGWTVTNACGKSVDEVFCSTDDNVCAGIPEAVRSTLAQGTVHTFDQPILLKRSDGTQVPITHRCAPIRDDEGVVNGSVLVLRDMTAEIVVREETENIQKQLVLAARMASVGTLAAGIAHEINNPLAWVVANNQMLAEELRAMGSSSGRIKDLLSMTQDSLDGAERIRKIVQGLKTFSRADEERLTNVELTPLLEFSLTMAANEIRHRARLVTDFKPTPSVHGDEARLGQVFINLLMNAAQAMSEEGEHTNEIRVSTWTSSSGDAVVEVANTGPGIPEAHLGRIFDPFFTTKPVGVGTGLGLFICRNIVMSMNGQISVTSEERLGTTFRVTLPPGEPVPAGVGSDGAASADSVGGQARVLVIDDEPSVGAVLSRLLRGHAVTVVTSGASALELLADNNAYDVILSDLMMPGMSGMDLYDAIRQTNRALSDRIVFITGGAFTARADEFLANVPNARLDKPFDLKAVRALVSTFVTAS